MNNLFNVSLWGDEAFSALAAQKPFFQMIGIVAKDTSPPLFYIINWAWFRIFGSSEIAIRSLSFLFYLATAIFIYLIGKELFSKQAGIIAALLSFFNPFLFPYAFEGRMYYCLLFFTVASFYFLIKKKRGGHIITASAVLYSHHFAIFAVFTQFVWELIINIRKNGKRGIMPAIKPYFIIGLIYLPWLYPFWLQTKLVSSGFWLGKPKINDLIGTFGNFLKHKEVFGFQKYLPIIPCLILIFRKWQKRDLTKDLLLILWATVPVVATFIISQTSLSIFYERYLLASVVPIMILLGSKIRKVSWISILIVLISYIAISWNYFTHPYKRPFREFASWIKTNVDPNIPIINYNGSAHHLWETKYYQIPAPIYSPGGPLPFFVGTAQMDKDDVIYQLPEAKIVGVISSNKPEDISIENYQTINYHQEGPLFFILMSKNEN